MSSSRGAGVSKLQERGTITDRRAGHEEVRSKPASQPASHPGNQPEMRRCLSMYSQSRSRGFPIEPSSLNHVDGASTGLYYTDMHGIFRNFFSYLKPSHPSPPPLSTSFAYGTAKSRRSEKSRLRRALLRRAVKVASARDSKNNPGEGRKNQSTPPKLESAEFKLGWRAGGVAGGGVT